MGSSLGTEDTQSLWCIMQQYGRLHRAAAEQDNISKALDLICLIGKIWQRGQTWYFKRWKLAISVSCKSIFFRWRDKTLFWKTDSVVMQPNEMLFIVHFSVSVVFVLVYFLPELSQWWWVHQTNTGTICSRICLHSLSWMSWAHSEFGGVKGASVFCYPHSYWELL